MKIIKKIFYSGLSVLILSWTAGSSTISGSRIKQGNAKNTTVLQKNLEGKSAESLTLRMGNSSSEIKSTVSHVSHSSHASHASHASHSSHRSG